MMWPDGSDKKLKSGASELFSPGQVPLPYGSPYGTPRLVVGRTGVLGDVRHEELRRLEGG